MLLITITRIPGGHRLLAASTYRACYYCWSLYRNGMLLQVISRSVRGETCISFELMDPLAAGHYELRVECFGWRPTGYTPDPSGQDSSHRTIQPIDNLGEFGAVWNDSDGKINTKFYYHALSAPLQTISDRANRRYSEQKITNRKCDHAGQQIRHKF